MSENLINDEPDLAEALSLVTDEELFRAWKMSESTADDRLFDAISTERARRRTNS